VKQSIPLSLSTGSSFLNLKFIRFYLVEYGPKPEPEPYENYAALHDELSLVSNYSSVLY
jgi:hypothetical protein